VIDRTVRQTYELPGHLLHIATLNLDQSWRKIERELSELVDTA
jgi:hypothetical protein